MNRMKTLNPPYFTAKDRAIENWSRAARLRPSSPLSEWLAVFPDRETLGRFRAEVANTSWPEHYGQSPWEDAWTVAINVIDGIHPTTVNFWAREIKTGTRWNVRDTLAKIALVRAYGGEIPPYLEQIEQAAA